MVVLIDGQSHFPKEIKMTKINAAIPVILMLLLSACSTPPTAVNTSQPPAATDELAGTYECFAVNGVNTSDLGTLTLHPDQTASFGPNSIRWQYDAETNMIIFDGDETLRNAIYFSEGQSLSVNENSEDHFTCVKSG